jgi:hypothetical protein
MEGQDLFISLKTCPSWVALKVSRLQKAQIGRLLKQTAKHALEKMRLYRENSVSYTR